MSKIHLTYQKFYSSLIKVCNDWEVIESNSRKLFLDLIDEHSYLNDICDPAKFGSFKNDQELISITQGCYMQQLQSKAEKLSNYVEKEYETVIEGIAQLENKEERYYYQERKNMNTWISKEDDAFLKNISVYRFGIKEAVSNYSNELVRKKTIIKQTMTFLRQANLTQEKVEREVEEKTDIEVSYSDFSKYKFIDIKKINNIIDLLDGDIAKYRKYFG